MEQIRYKVPVPRLEDMTDPQRNRALEDYMRESQRQLRMIFDRMGAEDDAAQQRQNRGAAPYIFVYDGPYEVTPSPDEVTLATNNKRMKDDVTVHGIPYQDMAGVSGGRIVTIG